MDMRATLALMLLCGAVTQASALRLGAGPKADDKLRRFVAENRDLRSRLDDAMRREALFRLEAGETDLRDAVADPIHSKEELIEKLPGMKVPPASKCPTFDACHQPEFAEAVEHSELLPDAIRRLMRPWMLLQDARGYKTEVTPSTKDDALLIVTLKGLSDAPLVLNVSPRLLGGFNVWFDEPARLASLYERERVLHFSKK